MKATAISLCAALLSCLTHAQVVPITANAATATITPLSVPVYSSPMVNSIRIWQLQKPVTDPLLVNAAISEVDAQQQIQYLDGLGRPVQTVLKAVTRLGKDMVAPVLYDNYGRVSLQYLPYAAATSDGSFKTNPFQD